MTFLLAKRAVPSMIVAGAGLFGLVLGSGNSLGCALAGILGSCGSKDSSANKQAITQAVSHVNRLQRSWIRVQNATNTRMFVVASTLTEVQKQQNALSEIQNEKIEKNRKQLETFVLNIHQFRSCNQYFCTRTSMNHHLVSLQGTSNMIFTVAKSFRTALYTFQSNLPQKISPMTFLPKEDLERTVETIGRLQMLSNDRLTLDYNWVHVLAEKLDSESRRQWELDSPHEASFETSH